MKKINVPATPFRWLSGVAGFLIISHAALIILVKDGNLRTALGDVVSPVADILIAITFFFTARFTASRESRKAISWRLWALAFVFYTLGDFSWAIFEVVLRVSPFPSIADLFYLIAYVFIWLGLVRYPMDEFLIRERKQVVLDNLIIVLGAGLTFWVFLIHPVILASEEVDFLAILLSVAYPIFDLLLLWTLLIFFRSRLQQSTHIPLVLMGLGALSQIIADSLFAYQSVGGSFFNHSLINLGWTAGLMFFLFAGIAQSNYTFAEKSPSQTDRLGKSFTLWPLSLPYMWLVISYGILAASISTQDDSLLLYLAVGLIIGLVIFRQVLTLNENERLYEKAREELAERTRAEEALRQTTIELDERVQERTGEWSFTNQRLLETNRRLEDAQVRAKENLQILSRLTNELSFTNEQLVEVNKKLEESLHEKMVLLKEVHHRVKNNLQVIVSLLRMQARGVKDPETINALQNSQTRVQSMSLIHEKLYQSQSLEKVDFGDYIKSLTGDLLRLYRHGAGGIKLDIQADEVALELDRAVPCGLLLNELVTNALKYAFPDDKKGTIWIELRAGPEQMLSLLVADDGVGFPADFDINKTKSLGLQLVDSLVSQLDGKLEIERSEKTVFKILFAY